MVNKSFKIGKITINDLQPALIVPEIGINHGGKIEVAIKMVDSAKRAGAKIIKHQTHIPNDEMSNEAKKVKPGNSKKNIFSIIKSCSLNLEEEYLLMQYVLKKNLSFISTPFSKLAVDRLVKFGVQAFKIGSGEFNNFPLLEYASKFKKPMILSTGMNDLNSIKTVYNFLKKKKINFAFLHTTSLYPTPDHLVRLNCLNILRKNFPNINIGYSDHTKCITAATSAISMGAKIIEKHFTDIKSRKGPDIICSMDEKELQKLILFSEKNYQQFQGNKNSIKEEKVTKNFAFVSVVSDKLIKKGKKLSKSNLWVRRPGNGDFQIKDLKKLYGKKVNQDIPPNIQIKKKHINF